MADEPLVNPWIGTDSEKAKAWESLSDRDKKWIGNADPTDEYILLRAPDYGAAQAANKSAALGQLPSFSDMIQSVKDGSIFKNIGAKINSLASAGLDEEQIAEMNATVENAKGTAMMDAAIAEASIAQKARLAKSQGRELSDAEINDALAPLSPIADIQSALKNAVSTITGAAGSITEKFGVEPAIDTTTPLTNPWPAGSEKAAAWEKLSEQDQRWLGKADPTDEFILARAPSGGEPRIPDFSDMTNALSSFKSSIPTAPSLPSAPIESVSVGGVTLPNPTFAAEMAEYTGTTLPGYDDAVAQFEADYAEFTSNPDNVAKMGALGDFEGVTSLLGGGLVAAFAASAETASAKKSDAIATLKAEGFLQMLSKPKSKAVSGTIFDTIDLSKFNASNVIKAVESAPPKVPNVVQKEPDDNRAGNSVGTQISLEKAGEVPVTDVASKVTQLEVDTMKELKLKARAQFNTFMGF